MFRARHTLLFRELHSARRFNWADYGGNNIRYACVNRGRCSPSSGTHSILLLNRWYSVKIFFIPPSCACISFFLAELNFSKTSILSAPGSIFHQTISPSTSRSLIPSVTQLDISIFLDISRHVHALHSIHRYICRYLWHWCDNHNVIYFHIKISLLNYIHYS